MSEFTGPDAEQIPVKLCYENDEGEPIEYEVTMAYGNVGGLIMAMDTLDGEDRHGQVGVRFDGDEDEEDLRLRMERLSARLDIFADPQ